MQNKILKPKSYSLKAKRGFTLIEVLVATSIFMLFAIGIYGGITFVFKVVYQSRIHILETAILSEQLEVIRNLEFEDIGIENGVPIGVIPYSQTIVRDGISFTILASVRNIDDPFDGTVGGDPDDSAPADYKLVELSAICANGCNQQTPIILNSIVAPKGLEGASDNGHLFVNVFNKDGLPVSGAQVQIINEATDPALVINDTTDNNGWLKVIDTVTGTLSYDITVSKAGYSTDYTTKPSVEITNPTKLPANVVSQGVTEIYFSIDELANLTLETIDQNCGIVASVPFNIYGEKTIGTEPIIYKLNESYTTDGLGIYNYSDIEWDDYTISVSSSNYMIIGTIPQFPLVVEPGQDQNISLILQNKTSNSLLVNVRDAGTGLPLTDATVILTGVGSVVTDLGYIRQTDWSGGSGQDEFVNLDEYFSDNSSMDVDSPDGDLKLKKVGGNYLSSGWLESSTFDLGGQVDFKNIIWEPLSQDLDLGDNPIKFQIATSNSSTPEIWDFYGPDGTINTYYTSTTTLIWSGADDNRYFRYKVYLSTSDTKKTPQLSEVSFTYTNSCIPPGQAFFGNLSASTYTLEVTKSGYLTNNGDLEIDGNLDTIVNLSVDE